MAKGARSSQIKRNNAKLRATVFGPAYDARTERLSAKLLELAKAPKPDQEKQMQVEEDAKDAEAAEQIADEPQDDSMQWTGLAGNASSSKKSKSASRSGRIAKRKPKNQVVFPSEIARRKRQVKSKKS